MFILLGVKTAGQLLCERDVALLGNPYDVVTEDGSLGHKGLVTDYLGALLEENPDRVYTCGPKPMMKAVSELVGDTPAQGAFEERMACGIGACYGCSIKIKDSTSKDGWTYKKVCTDGPVFDLRDVWFG